MIGSRRLTILGAFRGTALGSGTDDEGPSGQIPTDGTSGKGVPLTLGEWALATGKVPSHTWGMQDASGNPAATVGSALPKTGASVLYQQAVAGWSRLAIRLPETSGHRLAFSTAAGPRPDLGSVAWFGYIDVISNSSTLPIITVSNNATQMHSQVTTTPVSSLRVAANTANGTGNPLTPGVMPMLAVYNKTAATAKLYTSQEIVTGTYNSGVGDGTVKGYGAAGAPASFNILLGAAWEGVQAEFSDSDARSMFQALGWTVPW